MIKNCILYRLTPEEIKVVEEIKIKREKLAKVVEKINEVAADLIKDRNKLTTETSTLFKELNFKF